MVINYAPTIILVRELHLLLDTIIQTLALSDWRQSGKKLSGYPHMRGSSEGIPLHQTSRFHSILTPNVLLSLLVIM